MRRVRGSRVRRELGQTYSGDVESADAGQLGQLLRALSRSSFAPSSRHTYTGTFRVYIWQKINLISQFFREFLVEIRFKKILEEFLEIYA